jgi:sugar phosphate isomerase/epimerase
MFGKGLSVATVPFYPCGDRFVVAGYRKDPYTFEQKLEGVASLGDVKGVELSYPAEFEDPVPVKGKLASLGIAASNLEVELFGTAKWKYGALCSSDAATRREAIALSCRCMDAAAELGCDQISLWPGQDGYDYPLQIDYGAAWARTIDSMREIAAHRPGIKIAVEYKMKEPRTHILLGTVCKTVMAIREAGEDNLGVMIDFGHAMMAHECPAESAVIASQYGKLFHVHLNDNFRGWDDDMIVGSVHLWETFDFIRALRSVGYDRWLSLDVFPYREESVPAMQASLDMVKRMVEAAERADTARLAELQKRSDAVGISAYLRELLLK